MAALDIAPFAVSVARGVLLLHFDVTVVCHRASRRIDLLTGHDVSIPRRACHP